MNSIDDESSAPDESELKNRPADVAVQQQRIPAWHPILDPEWMIYSFLILAIIMIPVGTCFSCLCYTISSPPPVSLNLFCNNYFSLNTYLLS